MPKIKLEQRSLAWHDLRRNSIGASDAPTIMGYNSRCTPYQLWRRKLSLDPCEPTNERMQRGIDLEEPARHLFMSVHGMFVAPEVFIHDQYEWMIASLDGITLDNKIVVEIKCPGKTDHSSALKGRVPKKYIPQLQHQLEVTKAEKVLYFSYNPEMEIKHATIEVYPDQAFIEQMLEKEKVFWRCLENLERPID